MAPAIPIGALLSIAVAPQISCRVGDVVVFLEGDRLIAHRVLLVLRAGSWCWLLEKGDANPIGQWRHASSVRGRAMSFTAPEQPAVTNLTDPVLASSGLRRHLIHWLTSLGGLRAKERKF